MKRPSFPSIDHSLLSPSGRMSKRARAAALKREGERLFPPGSWALPPPPTIEDKRLALLRSAANLRELAARGMSRRKFIRDAERIEAQAAALKSEPEKTP